MGITEREFFMPESKIFEVFRGSCRKAKLDQALQDACVWIVRANTPLLIAILAVRLIHFVLPTPWAWLTEQQIKRIDNACTFFVLNELWGRTAKRKKKSK
jgi:hypothetical protein